MCTSITLSAKDGTIVTGRTNELNAFYEAELVFIPRNHKLKSSWLPATEFTFKTKYSFIYANMPGIIADKEITSDGFNEEGLSVSLLYFNYHDYRTLKASEVKSHHVNVMKAGTWILGNIKDIDELKAREKELEDIFYFDHKMKQQGLGHHLAIADKNGNNVVIEFENKKIIIKDNPIGVLTNSSPLEWHYENLRSYSHLSQFEVNPTLFKKLPENKLLTTGNGLIGMPGDFTGNSRFIRVAILGSIIEEQENADELVRTIFRILHTSDIIPGYVGEPKTKKAADLYIKMFPNSVVSKIKENTFYNHTDSFIVKDLTNLKIYYKTYNNLSIRMIDLSAIKDTNKVIKITMYQDQSQDIQEMKLS